VSLRAGCNPVAMGSAPLHLVRSGYARSTSNLASRIRMPPVAVSGRMFDCGGGEHAKGRSGVFGYC
jgi:hypothetical protein